MKNQKAVYFVLLIIFFLSGFSSLIYQVAWQRLLTLHYGLGYISTGIIVSLYMLGLGIGALIGERLSARMNQVAAYCYIELLIGVFGIISPYTLNFLGELTAGVNYFYTAIFIFIFLCLPTFCMGATLPLLSSIYRSSNNYFLSSISLLYFVNTLGAAFGALISSFVFISLFGLKNSINIAAVINLLLALLIGIMSRRKIEKAGLYNEDTATGNEPDSVSRKFIAYMPMIIFLSGFIAIGYEIIWFRLSGILLKDSPYAFSSILFVYLFGIAIGSYWMSLRKKNFDLNNKIRLFTRLQLYIAAYSILIILAFYLLSKNNLIITKFSRYSFSQNLHPNFNLKMIGLNWFLVLDTFIWPAFFLLVPAFCMGAGFPLIADIQYHQIGNSAKSVSKTYFFNVVGNVLGGIFMSFLILPLIGTEKSLLLLGALGCVFYFFVCLYNRKNAVKAAVFLVTCFVVLIIFPSHGNLYKVMHNKMNNNSTFHLTEGIEGIVNTEQAHDTIRSFINGSQHGGRPGYSFQYQVYKSLAFVDKAEKVLVIGFGTGTNVEAYLASDKVKEVTLVEINSTLIENLLGVPETEKILRHKKLKIVVEDGRRFLLNTDEKYDIISMDPLRTTTAYSNNIYSVEFFKLLHEHLKNEGCLVLWSDNMPVISKTVHTAFKHLWLYNAVILAANVPLVEDTAYYNSMRETFPEEGKKVADQYNREFRGNEIYVEQHFADVEVNTDWMPVSEYYIWRRH